VLFHDPHISTWRADGHLVDRVPDLNDALRTADLTILLQGHSAYDFTSIAANGKRVLDTRGVVPASSHVERL
jgi:UDP-N-acetyl-D-glucosamine dehydrogenase